MVQLPTWVSKIQSLWVLIGALLTGLSATVGLEVPAFLSSIFSQEFFDAFLVAVTGVFTFYQVIKALIIVSPPSASGLLIKRVSKTDALKYVLNPFKLRAS